MEREFETARMTRQGIIDHALCEDCDEMYVFELEKGDERFGMGLSTVLACLAFAEQRGAVPELPPEWWRDVANEYR